MQILKDKNRHVVKGLEVTQLYDRNVLLASWGVRKEGSNNYRRGTSNWMNEYRGTMNVKPTFPKEKFLRSFGITRNFFKRLKRGILNRHPMYLENRTIVGRRPSKPAYMNVKNVLNMLSRGNSADRNEDM